MTIKHGEGVSLHDILSAANMIPAENSWSMIGGGGLMVVKVNKPNITIINRYRYCPSEPDKFARFDPGKLTVDERREMAYNLRVMNLKTSEIALILNVSNTTVFNDIKIAIYNKRKRK